MFLAIDCGNTNIVFALYKDENKSAPIIWRCRSDEAFTADEYASWLSPLLQNEKLAFTDVTDVLIGSVVPDVNFNLRRLCEKYFKVEPNFIKPDGSNCGIGVNLPEPKKVGADQLVNAVAAVNKYKLPCVVIDFGTATTFDIVNKDGEYSGAVICPGVNLSVDALYRAAALLPKVVIDLPEKVIGHNTVTAMQSGLYWGYVSMIEGIIKRIAAELGEKPTIVATGGLSPLFMNATDVIEYADPELTLEGLRLIHLRNKNSQNIQTAA